MKQFIIFFLFVSFQWGNLFAFPIPMLENWKAKPGIALDYSENSKDWEHIPSLTFQSTQLKNFPEGEIIHITLYKSFELTEEEYKNLDADISVLFYYASNVHEFYLNGHKIGGLGKIENGKILRNGSKGYQHQVLPLKILQSGTNHLYVVLAGERDEEISLYGNSNTTIDYLSNHQFIFRERITLILLSLYFLLGLYHLLLFIKRPIDKYNGLFALFCITASLYLYLRTTIVYELDLDSLVKEKAEYISVFYASIFLIAFWESLILKRFTIYLKSLFGYITILSIVIIVSSKAISTKMLFYWQLSMLFSLGWMIYLMFYGIKNKLKDSKRLAIGFFAFALCLLSDVLGAMHIIPGLNNLEIAKYGFLSFVMGIAAILANRFMELHRSVEELNLNLEHKVKVRTAELQETLNHVQQLKFQQDGDYFLTSLLIKPLMVNAVVSNTIKIEFFIKQKKTFEFKGKIHEIGGDICIANNINLRGKKYCVFINGDAMGKSIQGAGGALVLGVVFRAAITRTQLNPTRKSPEQWLKSCFSELQNVFVSFDGSMLISVVMGLVEEKTGMMYYINAEHPWIVLYRDGKASFLEDSLSLRKIGMLGTDGNLTVKTFHLQSNDSILIGSDGRDDILLSINEKGERVINEDEFLFLRNVEAGKADLQEVTENIWKVGELTDDYTLIKISYKPFIEPEINYEDNSRFYEIIANAETALHFQESEKACNLLKEALVLKENHLDTLHKIIHIMFQLKKYKEMIFYCERYMDLWPADTEVMFILSSVYKLNNQLEEAIDIGESLRLREPWNIKNYINLADAYRLAKNYQRANKMLNTALEKEPENEKALKLKAILQSQN